MTAEDVTTLIEIVSAIAASAAALFLFLTWRVASHQLTGLNKATQLQNFVALTQEFDGAQFSAANSFLLRLQETEAPERRRLFDEDAESSDPKVDRVLNFFERIAFLSERGYLDRDLTIRWFGTVAVDAYESAKPLLVERNKWDSGAGADFKRFAEEALELHSEPPGVRVAIFGLTNRRSLTRTCETHNGTIESPARQHRETDPL